MKLSDRAVRYLGSFAIGVGGVALAATLTRVFIERNVTFATGVQLALLVVCSYQLVTLPRSRKRWMAELETVKAEIDAANAEGLRILGEMELTGPDRAELEAWRAIGEMRGIKLTREVPKVH